MADSNGDHSTDGIKSPGKHRSVRGQVPPKDSRKTSRLATLAPGETIKDKQVGNFGLGHVHFTIWTSSCFSSFAAFL